MWRLEAIGWVSSFQVKHAVVPSPMQWWGTKEQPCSLIDHPIHVFIVFVSFSVLLLSHPHECASLSSSSFLEALHAPSSSSLHPPLPPSSQGSFANNTVHSSVAGVWLTASTLSQQAYCTELSNLTSYLTWDFGVITTTGITTSVRLTDVNLIDAKHVSRCM
jgi:hypothetical protein